MRKSLARIVGIWGTIQDTVSLVGFLGGLAFSGVLGAFAGLVFGSWPAAVVLALIAWAATEVALVNRANRRIVEAARDVSFSISGGDDDTLLTLRVTNAGPSREFTAKLTAVHGASSMSRDLPIALAWDGGVRGPVTIHRGDTVRLELFSYWQPHEPQALVVGEPFSGPVLRFRDRGQPDPAVYELTATVTVWADGEPVSVDLVAGLDRERPDQILPTRPFMRLA